MKQKKILIIFCNLLSLIMAPIIAVAAVLMPFVFNIPFVGLNSYAIKFIAVITIYLLYPSIMFYIGWKFKHKSMMNFSVLSCILFIIILRYFWIGIASQ